MADETFMVTGGFYRFKVSAVNQIGESPLSNYVTIAMAQQAPTPSKPTVNRELSTLTSVYVEWSQGEPGDIPVDGYQLFMIELSAGLVSLVYDGSNNDKVFG